MLTLRRWHAWLGLLIAPSVLFFALTGAVQLFGLHESHGNYRPPALIEKLSSVHKDQVFAPGHHGEPPPGEQAASEPSAGGDAKVDQEAHHDGDEDSSLSTTLLKYYFLMVALMLVVSTGFGIWMGISQLRRPRQAWALLLIGTLLPLALVIT